MTRRVDVENQIVVVKVVGRADGGRTPHDGRYVAHWNPHTRAGILELTSTPELAQARRFTRKEAFLTWKQVSHVEAIRPWDHKPNRPLTGVTIEVINAEARYT